MMNTKTHSALITPANGNVFSDLGFEPDLAAALKEASQRIIADRLADETKHSETACPESNTSGNSDDRR